MQSKKACFDMACFLGSDSRHESPPMAKTIDSAYMHACPAPPAGGGIPTCMSLGARVELLQVIDVAPQKLGILQAVLHCGSAPEGEHCCSGW